MGMARSRVLSAQTFTKWFVAGIVIFSKSVSRSCFLQTLNSAEFSHLFWDEVSQNEDHLFCNLNEHTPIKKCSNLGHQITDVRGRSLLCGTWWFFELFITGGTFILDATTKGLEECREPLQLKRRRTLQFTSDSTEVANEQMNSAFLTSKVHLCEVTLLSKLHHYFCWLVCFFGTGDGVFNGGRRGFKKLRVQYFGLLWFVVI